MVISNGRGDDRSTKTVEIGLTFGDKGLFEKGRFAAFNFTTGGVNDNITIAAFLTFSILVEISFSSFTLSVEELTQSPPRKPRAGM